jgi:hypothetical protein
MTGVRIQFEILAGMHGECAPSEEKSLRPFSEAGRIPGGDRRPGRFNALEVVGAMAKGEGWWRLSLARLVSHLPSFPSAHDLAQLPGELRAR